MLQKIGFLPGFNKQITPTGAEAQWTEGENVRFRYGTPEKVGGWKQTSYSNSFRKQYAGIGLWINKFIF